MKERIVKSLVLAVLVLLFAVSFVGPADAQKKVKPEVLSGTYAVIGHNVCVGNWVSGPVGTPFDIYWTKTSTVQGITTFYPDGTGTGEFEQLSIVHPLNMYTEANTSTTKISINFTYAIDPVTRKITQIIQGSGQFISPTATPLAGKYLTFGAYTQTGFVSLDKGTIISSTVPINYTDPDQFTRNVIIWNDPGHTQKYGEQQETCQRNRVSTQISK